MKKPEWEIICDRGRYHGHVERLKVVGGWLYHVIGGHGGSVCFVPDNPSITVTLPSTATVGTKIDIKKPCKHGKEYCALCDAILLAEKNDYINNHEGTL